MSTVTRKEARRQAEVDAEGARLGAAFGMGEYLTGRAGQSTLIRVVIGKSAFILVSPMLAIAIFAGTAGFLLRSPGTPLSRGDLHFFRDTAILTVVVMTALVLATFPPRVARGQLFVYRDGIIAVDDREPRPAVMRDADLATLSLDVVRGYDGTHLRSCVLGDKARNVITVSGLHGPGAVRLAADHAGPVLSGRPGAIR